VNVDTAHVLRRIRPSASKAQKCGSQEDPRDHLRSVQHMDQLRPRPTWPCADLASCIHLFGDVSLRWLEASLRLVPGKALWVRLQELLDPTTDLGAPVNCDERIQQCAAGYILTSPV